jgi:hypothetical protein
MHVFLSEAMISYCPYAWDKSASQHEIEGSVRHLVALVPARGADDGRSKKDRMGAKAFLVITALRTTNPGAHSHDTAIEEVKRKSQRSNRELS